MSRNQLLRALSADDLNRLGPHLEPCSLRVRDVLVEPCEPIEYVYFIEQGIASHVAISPYNERLEVGTLGREGMSGTTILMGVDRAPDLTFMHVPGSGLRMKSSSLQEAMEESLTLRKLLLGYLHTTTVQAAHVALANGRFTIMQRLARWLLMSRDRVDSDDIALTHEFVATMLGVRRPGVTEELHKLEGDRIIKSARGRVTLLNRSRLEDIADGCYGLPEQEYARVISGAEPPLKRSRSRVSKPQFARGRLRVTEQAAGATELA